MEFLYLYIIEKHTIMYTSTKNQKYKDVLVQHELKRKPPIPVTIFNTDVGTEEIMHFSQCSYSAYDSRVHRYGRDNMCWFDPIFIRDGTAYLPPKYHNVQMPWKDGSVCVKLLSEEEYDSEDLEDDLDAILIWKFNWSPNQARSASQHGGDEDWIGVISEGTLPEWIADDKLFGCSGISLHEFQDCVVFIGAHA
jgi:hypothetical protein